MDSYKEIIILAATIAILAILFLTNKPKKYRYKQLENVFASLLFLGLYMTVYIHRMDIVNSEWFSAIWAWFDQLTQYDYIIKIREFLQTFERPLLYLFTLLLVLLYTLFKSLMMIGFYLKKLFKKEGKLTSLESYFYEEDEDGIFVKDRWIFIGKVNKVLGVVFFILSILYVYQDEIVLLFVPDGVASTFKVHWPIFLPIASLVMLEIGFFLDGLESNPHGFKLFIEELATETITKLDKLYEGFKKQFADKLLAGTKRSLSPKVTDIHYEVKNSYLKSIYKEFKEENTQTNNKYFEGLDLLVSNEAQNVLFSNAYDENYAVYLRIFFDHAYMHNQRIMIIVLDESERESTLNWVQELVSEEVYQAREGTDFDYTNKSHHILVDTIRQTLYSEKIVQKYGDFPYVLILDLKNFIRKNHLYLNTFLNVYQSKLGYFPKIMGFSNVSNMLETSFNLIFVGDSEATTEIRLNSNNIHNEYLLIFKAEGMDEFGDYIDLNKGQHIGKEVPLGYYAWDKGGIRPIVLSSDHSSISEELEALENIVGDNASIRSDMKVVKNRFFNHITDADKVFVVEDMLNLRQTVLKWRNYAISKEMLLVVVSRNYLFREYFTANFLLTLERDDWYGEIFPQGTRSKREQAFLLLSRLASSQIERSEIVLERDELVNRESIARFISRYTKHSIEPSLISVEAKRELIATHAFEDPEFIRKIYYTIPNYSYFPDMYYYTFVNSNGKSLGICLEDDIYHKYIHGMEMVLHDKVYRIIDIDSVKKIVNLEFRDTTQISEYQIYKTISLTKKYGQHQTIQNKKIQDISLIAYIQSMDYRCRISQYQEKCNKKELFRLDTPAVVSYTGKETLVIQYQGSKIITDKLRRAFEFIFSEILQTLFPKTHHLLSVRALLKEEESTFVCNEIIGERLTIQDNEMIVYIFETGKHNYHLLNTIIDKSHYERILMLIQDFIVWSRANDKPIISAVEEEESTERDFDSLVEFIDILLQHNNKITKYRSGESIEVASFQAEHYCDFCAQVLPLQYESLKDGREICEQCKKNSVEYQGIDYRSLVKDAITYLEGKYQITINQDLNIKIVNAETIAKELGKTFSPTPGYDARAVGLAISGEPKTVLIENSAPLFRAMEVIAHELTHIWQYHNLDFDKMDHDEMKIEGHAQWVGLTYVEEKYPAQEQFIQTEKNREDAYGIGYRYVEQVLENTGGDNPFVVYRNMFGKE